MNQRVCDLVAECFSISRIVHPGAIQGGTIDDIEKYTALIVSECCAILYEMHEKTKGNHNYYGHAALEVKRKMLGLSNERDI